MNNLSSRHGVAAAALTVVAIFCILLLPSPAVQPETEKKSVETVPEVEMKPEPEIESVVFKPETIGSTDAEISNPGRGGYPADGIMNPPDWPTTDVYVRVNWRQIETARDVYNWAIFDKAKAAAEAKKGKWGFRVMAANSLLRDAPTVPSYLVDLMPNGFWFTYPGNSFKTYAPDWNDPDLLTHYQALLTAISSRYGNDKSFGWVESGLFGDFAEWHTWQYPYDGTAYAPSPNGKAADMTTESLRTTIDMHVNTFPNQRIIMPFDERHMIPYWTAKYPEMGYRRDCLGSPYYFSQHWAKYYDLVKDRWKTTPFINETCRMNTGSDYFTRMQSQVRDYHVAMIAGANMQNFSELTQSEQALLKAAYKASGYRFTLKEVKVNKEVAPGDGWAITSRWLNDGVTPAYSDWKVTFLLKDSKGAVRASSVSRLSLKTLLPNNGKADEIVDTVTIPEELPEGKYTLAVQVNDAGGYYDPLRLANAGRLGDGSYALGQITVKTH